MSKTIRNLALLFAAQVILALIIWSVTGTNNDREAKPFLTADVSTADRITIKGNDGEVVMAKTDGEWVLPTYGNMKVVEKKLNEVIAKLKDNTVRWPAATTTAAQKRFEVAEDNAQKTLRFEKAGKTLATVYLGTSPNYRKLNARVDDSKEIYTIDFAHFDLPAKQEEWFDRSLLKFAGTISGVKTDQFNLQKTDDNWALSVLTEGKTLDQEKVTSWVERFTRMVVNSRVEDAEVEKITVQNPVQNIEVVGSDEKGTEVSIGYAFYKIDDKYYVKKYGENHLFVIAKYVVEPIIDAVATEFEKSVEDAEPSVEEPTPDTTEAQ